MDTTKSRSLEHIESQMEGVEQGSIRHQVLQCAKNFKTSWVELGRSLYAVWKDKNYKAWGYITFEAYTAKEIGIKKQTAMKLLKSYYFLEKEEPELLTKEHTEEASPATIPSYETVNILRLAKDNEAVDKVEYNRLKKDALEGGKEPREIKKDLTMLMRQREELDPEEAREKKRSAAIRRFLGTLKALKTEFETSKMVSGAVLKEVSALIKRIEMEAG
jgi:hypothetical protein